MRLPSDQNASGRSLADEELRLLREVIESGTLISTKGSYVKEFESRFAGTLGLPFGYACSSGTAAIHCAVTALDPMPGDEIITSPITDMGAITPILYQGAIPVFADVDPRTGNLTAASIAERISERTRAIIVTHLLGNPCEMGEIMELADRTGVPVVEDSAQAFGAESDGRPVGSIGTIGCFSLQQGKHITTGEGGLVVTSDEAFARRIRLSVNKAWGYGEENPDHYFLALNYRMTELQGAVGLAQLDKLDAAVRQRIETAEALTRQIGEVAGLRTPWVAPSNRHSYWKYSLLVDAAAGGPKALAGRLAELGIASAPNYVGRPAFALEMFREQRTFGSSRYPFTLARPEALDYAREAFPGTYEYLDGVLVLPWNEKYTSEHVAFLAESLDRVLHSSLAE